MDQCSLCVDSEPYERGANFFHGATNSAQPLRRNNVTPSNSKSLAFPMNNDQTRQERFADSASAFEADDVAWDRLASVAVRIIKLRKEEIRHRCKTSDVARTINLAFLCSAYREIQPELMRQRLRETMKERYSFY
jgi:hypothetical protein